MRVHLVQAHTDTYVFFRTVKRLYSIPVEVGIECIDSIDRTVQALDDGVL